MHQKDWSRRLAICEYNGSQEVNISWAVPGNNTGKITFSSELKNNTVIANSTYEFPIILHEGQNLTCVIQEGEQDPIERTLHIPKYYMSMQLMNTSIAGLNTVHSADPALQIIVLQRNRHNQRVLLNISSNVSSYKLSCVRKCRESGSSKLKVEGNALVFEGEVTEKQAGLYMCQVTYYHHRVSLGFEVQVASAEISFWKFILICVCSLSAFIIIVILFLCFLCKKTGEDLSTSKNKYKKKSRESTEHLTLMLDPKSPELLKSPVKHSGQEYAELVRYSIVIDVKTTV
ncbi:uncharacterized protein LOC136746992 isoform X2 [Amia ocellicauda]|uniref:uncharacterized protein LOC136746992 isoform X2 n=1 Tax=Amia ocellicauda TaxID=2972642 RepID=UPI003464B045